MLVAETHNNWIIYAPARTARARMRACFFSCWPVTCGVSACHKRLADVCCVFAALYYASARLVRLQMLHAPSVLVCVCVSMRIKVCRPLDWRERFARICRRTCNAKRIAGKITQRHGLTGWILYILIMTHYNHISRNCDTVRCPLNADLFRQKIQRRAIRLAISFHRSVFGASASVCVLANTAHNARLVSRECCFFLVLIP